MFSGIIYCATSPSKKKYYGYTSAGLDGRKCGHKKDVTAGVKNVFYDAIRKYGWESFEWIIIEEYNTSSKEELKEILCEREAYWISKNKTYLREYGYNMTLGGEGILGYKYTDKQKENLSIRMSGKNNPMYGKKHTIESIEKNRNSNIGKKHTEETKKKMSEVRKGKNHTQESKQKIGDKHRNKIVSKETREKLSKYRTGRTFSPHSEETKKKMSEAQKGRKQPRIRCPYCNKSVTPSTLARWHNENCKNYNLILNRL
jgi:hypothetical protein